LQEANPAFRVPLAFVASQKLVWRQVEGVEFIGGQEETPVLVAAGLSRSE
jgi:hypothetical protein